jgi:mono/diheme cytochrome c family protein
MRSDICSFVVATVTAAVVTATLAVTEAPQRKPTPDYSSGPYLYRTFCASCHGEAGGGDGPVADLLRVPAPDLRTIRARSGGSFPRARIIAIVDGRTPVPGHGRGEMPVWGDVLRITEGQDERTIAARIAALVTHLESLQVGAAR